MPKLIEGSLLPYTESIVETQLSSKAVKVTAVFDRGYLKTEEIVWKHSLNIEHVASNRPYYYYYVLWLPVSFSISKNKEMNRK